MDWESQENVTTTQPDWLDDVQRVNETGESEPVCDADSNPTTRLVIICIGTVISVVGILGNALLLYAIVCRQPRLPRRSSSKRQTGGGVGGGSSSSSSTAAMVVNSTGTTSSTSSSSSSSSVASLYNTALAFLDLCLCIIYVLCFGAFKITQVLRVHHLFDLISINMVRLMVVSRVVQCAIPYVLIASSAERLAALSNTSAGFESRKAKRSKSGSDYSRAIVVSAIVLVILALRLPFLFAVDIVADLRCDYFYSRTYMPTEFGTGQLYANSDLVISFLHTFFSFLVLLFLNMIIIQKLRTSFKDAKRRCSAALPVAYEMRTLETAAERAEHKRLRCAIKTTVVLISSYLACNSVHFVLYIVERLNLTQDETGNFYPAYELFSDIGTLLFVVSSMMRIFIYYAYNPTFRTTLRSIRVVRCLADVLTCQKCKSRKMRTRECCQNEEPPPPAALPSRVEETEGSTLLK